MERAKTHKDLSLKELDEKKQKALKEIDREERRKSQALEASFDRRRVLLEEHTKQKRRDIDQQKQRVEQKAWQGTNVEKTSHLLSQAKTEASQTKMHIESEYKRALLLLDEEKKQKQSELQWEYDRLREEAVRRFQKEHETALRNTVKEEREIDERTKNTLKWIGQNPGHATSA